MMDSPMSVRGDLKQKLNMNQNKYNKQWQFWVNFPASTEDKHRPVEQADGGSHGFKWGFHFENKTLLVKVAHGEVCGEHSG